MVNVLFLWSLFYPSVWRYSFTLSSRSFIVLPFMFRSTLYLELVLCIMGGVAVRFYFLLYRYLVPYPRLLERLSSFHCIAIFVINQVTIYMDLFLDSVPLAYLSIFTPNLHCLIIIALQIILKPGSVYFVVIPQDCFILFFPILTLFISFSRLLHWLKFLVQQKWW